MRGQLPFPGCCLQNSGSLLRTNFMKASGRYVNAWLLGMQLFLSHSLSIQIIGFGNVFFIRQPFKSNLSNMPDIPAAPALVVYELSGKRGDHCGHGGEKGSKAAPFFSARHVMRLSLAHFIIRVRTVVFCALACCCHTLHY